MSWTTKPLKALLAILLVFAWINPTSPASAEADSWTRYGPGSGSISSIVVDPLTPTTVYAGAIGGVFKSTDGGDSWSLASMDLYGRSIYSLAIDPLTPETLYAGSDFVEVYKSTDGGASWNPTGDGITQKVYALAVDPLTPTTLYAGTWEHGIFKSTNGGESWIRVQV